MSFNFLWLAGSVLVTVLLGAALFERWKRKMAGARLPISEKLLRPAGYTLSKGIEKAVEVYGDWSLASFIPGMDGRRFVANAN